MVLLALAVVRAGADLALGPVAGGRLGRAGVRAIGDRCAAAGATAVAAAGRALGVALGAAGGRRAGRLRRGGGRLQTALRAGGDVEVRVEVRAGRVGLGRLRLPELERPVDERPLVQVVPVDEGDRDAGLARTARAARPVQVRLVVVGDGVVDHVGHVVDVDAAGGDVGRDQHVLLAGLERGHRALALVLVQVAVHGRRVEAAVVQLLDELGRRALGAREDHGLAAALGLQDARDHLVLVERVRPVDEVLDVRLRQALVGVVRADVDRLRHEPAREGDDRAGHGRGEQHGVPHGRNLREDLLDVGEEAEVEHLVGLVEHDLLHLAEVQEALAGQVEETAGGADDDLRAGLDLLDLPLVRLAAVDRDDLRRALGGGELEVLGHLHRELAGRHDDERLDAGLGVVAEALDEREAEAEGLARAGLRLADDVLAGEGEGDGLLLDGEGIDDALPGEGIDDVRRDAELGESSQEVLPCRVRSRCE
ncbi:hypothetical protein GCM10010196_14610 [Agromyces mediolanus]|uniref:Uncharacterized protein n=1 Tax=Agromyces mediolanus TaxID=41986 RepID=A0A918CGS3_AGRME|nr:hypothetical protein GCM10010196_14610 [Agromyces mediolanus]